MFWQPAHLQREMSQDTPFWKHSQYFLVQPFFLHRHPDCLTLSTFGWNANLRRFNFRVWCSDGAVMVR